MHIDTGTATQRAYDARSIRTNTTEPRRQPVPGTPSDGPSKSEETVSLSSLGRALATAISRAEASYATSSRGELRAIVKRAHEGVLMGEWRRDATKPEQAVPKGGDDERVTISRHATAFVGKVTRLPRPLGLERDNPFYGLGRSELAAIKYDESGTFTVNERRAAASEAGRQYEEWSAAASARAWGESTQTGKLTNFLREVLAYFDALPPIEKEAAPEGYEKRLRATVSASAKDDTPYSPEWLNNLLPRHWRTELPMDSTTKDNLTC